MEFLGYELTDALSKEAYTRDKEDLLSAFNPRFVQIVEEPTPAGCLGLFRITVYANTFILTGEEDLDPKDATRLTFRMKVFTGYPAIAPKVYFESNCRLAHINTFKKGGMCIDKWTPRSNLKNTVEKTVRAIVFDPSVTNYRSPACADIIKWQTEMEAKKAFPTLNPDLILRGSSSSDPTASVPPALPGRHLRAEPAKPSGPPPLPPRR